MWELGLEFCKSKQSKICMYDKRMSYKQAESRTFDFEFVPRVEQRDLEIKIYIFLVLNSAPKVQHNVTVTKLQLPTSIKRGKKVQLLI
jgi:hypothetical protein